jgi:DNA-binding NarL/FixJ family response regulator
MKTLSVFFIDSNATFLGIATRLLQDYYQHKFTLVGTATSYDEALFQVARVSAELLLLGVGQQSLEGLRIIPDLRAAVPGACIIVLGSLDIAAYRQAALNAGAHAFIAKVALNTDLLPTIERLLPDQRSRSCGGKS